MMEILSVAVGGALGAVCRYLLGNFIGRMSGSAFPWGTFAININYRLLLHGTLNDANCGARAAACGLAPVLVRRPVGRLHYLFLVRLRKPDAADGGEYRCSGSV